MNTVLAIEDMIRPSQPWSLPPAAGAEDRTALEGILAEAEQSFLDTFGRGAPDAAGKNPAARPPHRRRNTFQTLHPAEKERTEPAAGAEDRTALEGILAEAEQSFLDTFGRGAPDAAGKNPAARPPHRRRNTFQTLHPAEKERTEPAARREPAPRDRISKRTLEALRYWTAAAYLRYGAVRTTPAGISARATFTQSEPVFDVARWARFYNEACMLMYRPEKKIYNLFNY